MRAAKPVVAIERLAKCRAKTGAIRASDDRIEMGRKKRWLELTTFSQEPIGTRSINISVAKWLRRLNRSTLIAF
jgi:hypothetical protein